MDGDKLNSISCKFKIIITDMYLITKIKLAKYTQYNLGNHNEIN